MRTAKKFRSSEAIKWGLLFLGILSGLAMTACKASDSPRNDEINSIKEIKKIKLGNNEHVTALAWSPGANSLGILLNEGSGVEVFDSNTWKKTADFETSASSVPSKSFSFFADRGVIAIRKTYDQNRPDDRNSILANWDTNTGRLIRTFQNGTEVGLESHNSGPIYFSASSNGKYVAVAGGRTIPSNLANKKLNSISYVDLFYGDDGALIKNLKWSANEKGLVRSIAFSDDGNFLAIGTDIGRIILIDVAHRNIVQDFSISDKYFPSCSAIAFSHDGKFIAVGKSDLSLSDSSSNSAVDVWDIKSGSRAASLSGTILNAGNYNHAQPVESLSWGLGDELAVADGVSVRVWKNVLKDPNLVLLRHFLTNASHSGASAVSFSKRNTLAVGANDEIIIFDGDRQ